MHSLNKAGREQRRRHSEDGNRDNGNATGDDLTFGGEVRQRKFSGKHQQNREESLRNGLEMRSEKWVVALNNVQGGCTDNPSENSIER